MTSLKILTINIMHDLTFWQARRNVLLHDLKELKPDVIAVQAANIPERTSEWVADEMGYDHFFLTPQVGEAGEREGIALISKLPFKSTDWLDLQGQSRVAQYGIVEVDGVEVLIVNGHYYYGSEEEIRLSQMESLLKWIRRENVSVPVVCCGDFNAPPYSETIARVLEEMESAHVIVHGDEPAYTCPTALRFLYPGKIVRGLFEGSFRGLRMQANKDTIDYIFVNSMVEVKDCKVVLDQPAAYNWRMYPSDHLGLLVEIEVKKDA